MRLVAGKDCCLLNLRGPGVLLHLKPVRACRVPLSVRLSRVCASRAVTLFYGHAESARAQRRRAAGVCGLGETERCRRAQSMVARVVKKRCC